MDSLQHIATLMVYFVEHVPEKIGGQYPGKFVTKEFNNWGNISQKLSAYSKRDYHLTSLAKMDEFLSRFHAPSQGWIQGGHGGQKTLPESYWESLKSGVMA